MTVPPPPGSAPPPPPTPPVPPPPGMPPMPPSGGQSQTNGLAVAAMILGIVSICFNIFTGIPAIILGFLGKKKANETGVGGGQAITGIILGFVGVLIAVVWFVLVVIVGIAADEAGSEFERSINEANKEYEDQSARNGDVAASSDYSITRKEVDVSSFGSVTYSSYIENTADFDTGFTVTIECEGNLGDKETYDAIAYNLSPGDKDNLQAFFSFATDTTSVVCTETEVLYGF